MKTEGKSPGSPSLHLSEIKINCTQSGIAAQIKHLNKLCDNPQQSFNALFKGAAGNEGVRKRINE